MKYLLFLMSFWSMVHLANAQYDETFQGRYQMTPSVGASGTLEFDFADLPFNYRLRKGRYSIGLEYLDKSATEDVFEATISIELNKGNELQSSIESQELLISSEETRSYVVGNIEVQSNEESTSDELVFDNVEVSVAEISDQADLSNISLFIEYQAELALNVKDMQSSIDEIQLSGRTLSVRWSDDVSITNYEMQVMKLYNYDASKNESNDITTRVDWKKAVSFDIKLKDKVDKHYSMTLSEGTGYYAIRLRPLGSYFDLNGNIFKRANAGIWSIFDTEDEFKELTGGNAGLDPSNGDTNKYIYFDDSQNDVNWIFTRQFAEDGKEKEVHTIADGLLNVKQEITYLPSQQISLIKQTVYDHGGRAAVQTLPIPIPDKINSYYTGFMTPENSTEVYQADNFDVTGKIADADLVDSDGAFSYYHNNEDPSIPNAGGFPYTRTIFYNDGTGRVKEQSGVGSAQNIASGKTTRYFHVTPSDQELVAMFGDEAPSNEKVFKTITVDPNNTSSVTYTDVAGNVIATSLIFNEQEGNNLEPLESSVGNSFNTVDIITKNVQVGKRYESSKRIYLPNQVDLNVDYMIEQEVIEGLCQKTDLDCGLKVDVYLLKLDSRGDVVSGQDAPVWSSLVADLSTTTKDDIPYREGSTTIGGVESGEYIVKKVIYSSGDPSAKISTNNETIRLGVMPIPDFVAESLEETESWDEAIELQPILKRLMEAVKSGNANNLEDAEFNLSTAFIEYFRENPSSYNMDLYPEDLDQDDFDEGKMYHTLVFKAPCCEDAFVIDIRWFPPFPFEAGPNRASKDAKVLSFSDYANPDLNAEFEFLPDFEGYLYSKLEYCSVIDDIIRHYRMGDDPYQYDGHPDDIPLWSDLAAREAFEARFNERVENMELRRSILKQILYQGGYLTAGGNEFYIDSNSPDGKNNPLIQNQYFAGWDEPGMFNRMVYNMLTADYEIRDIRSDADAELDQLPDKYNYNSELESDKQGPFDSYLHWESETKSIMIKESYDPEYLFDCWRGIVSLVELELCGDGVSFEDERESQNISNTYDDKLEEDEGRDEGHDPLFDAMKGKGFKIIRWLMSRRLSRRMRDRSEGIEISIASFSKTSTTHIVHEFLKCSGYRFASAITAFHPLPQGEDTSPNFNYSVDFDINDSDYQGQDELQDNEVLGDIDPYSIESKLLVYLNGFGTYRDVYKNGLNGEFNAIINSYVPIKGWAPTQKEIDNDTGLLTDVLVTDQNGDAVPQKLFPHIRNPLYAFKYYEYNRRYKVSNVYFTDDVADRVNIFQDLEAISCFTDPNDGWVLDDETDRLELQDGEPTITDACKKGDNETNCYFVSNYPSTGEGKLIVNDFCGNGRILCARTHETWLASQHYSFYKQYNAYRLPSDKELEIEAEAAAKGGHILDNANYNCDYFNERDEWYEFVLTDSGDELFEDDLEAESEFTRLLYEAPNFYRANDPEKDNSGKANAEALMEFLKSEKKNMQVYRKLTWGGDCPDGEDCDTYSLPEYFMNELDVNCNSRCESRREDFRTQLLKTLDRRCYLIGGCRTDDPSVIFQQDIETILDQLVEGCKEQCHTNTFSCESVDCRPVDTPKTSHGYARQDRVMEYGVSSLSDLNNANGLDYSLKNTVSDELEFEGLRGPVIRLPIYDEDGNYYDWSWKDYTYNNQVMEWTALIELPDYCESDNPPLPADYDDTTPNNENKGHTYVRKEDYIREVNKLTDNFNDPVNSPAKSYNVYIPE